MISKKTFLKPIVILLICVTLSLTVAILSRFGFINLLMHIDRWSPIIEDFNIYIEDFGSLADFCSDYIAEKVKENPSSQRWISYGKGQLFYNGNIVDLPPSIVESLRVVSSAFPNPDSQFDMIWCDEDIVYFCTHDGEYSVVRSPLSYPNKLAPERETDCLTRKITDKWYHVVRK